MSRRYDCDTCEDWGTVVRPDGKGTEPCPADCDTARALANRQNPNGENSR